MSAVAELDHESDADDKPTGPKSLDTDGRSSPDSSGVGAAGSARTQIPSEEQLLDVLYEVLVQGVPPRSKLTREQVEQFLHEHARDTKSIGDMLAFFEQHELPLSPRDYGADRELGELATGLQRERSSMMPGFGAAESQEPARVAQPSPQTFPPASQPAQFVPAATQEPIENEPTGRRKPPVTRSSRGLRWVVGVAATLAVGASVAFALNYQRSVALEQRLDQARMQQRSTDAALSKLEQRAESLQGALNHNEAAHERETEQLKSTLEEQAKKRATEEQAIEKVLGPRYLRLRQKLSDQAAANAPGAPRVEQVKP